MKKKKTKPKKNEITYIVERVYVGDKPMRDVFERVIEHVVRENIKNESQNKLHG